MNVAIVGCGLIGSRRAKNLREQDRVTAAFDPDPVRAKSVCENTFPTLQALLAAKVADVAVVATVNVASVPAVQACLDAGLDVLVEKPAARNIAELRSLRVPAGRRVKVGYNKRFHPAYQALRRAMRADDPIMYIRARYGNGARVGFEKEWRAQVEVAGGGELLDQGAHVIDLASSFLPDLSVRGAWVRTHFWNMAVDDNAWAIMTTPLGQTFDMHVSSTEWKNEFQFDVYTRTRKFTWWGLGGSYGQEKLTTYQMKPEMGPPDVDVQTFDGPDPSWRREWEQFMSDEPVDGGLPDADRTLSLVDAIYRMSASQDHPTPHPRWLTSER